MKTFPFFAAMLAILLTACAPAATEKAPASALTPSQADSITSAALAPPPVALPLHKTVWTWQYTRQSGTQLAPVAPAHYTLIFQEENRLSIAADCNRGGTVYRIQDDLLTLDLIAMTKMLCPAGSLDRDFLNGLHAVDRYRIDGRTLTLQLRSGGEMVFTPAQP
ncbi:MAG: META domain-containing protein [Burkholderiales bacterium]|jgi:heat shock protein HslJ|nr:META domain-containing protein [Burkholderiales bacterium]